MLCPRLNVRKTLLEAFLSFWFVFAKNLELVESSFRRGLSVVPKDTKASTTAIKPIAAIFAGLLVIV
jgi:hypothetical protein